MKNIIFKNTIEKGSFRYIIFMENNTWHGLALEFNLVVSADTAELAYFELFEVVKGYVDSVKKSKSRTFALNQKPDPEYIALWKNALKGLLKDSKTKKIPSPYIHSYGVSNVLA